MKSVFVISGPESTGKSTLAQSIAEDLNATLVEEYARDYLEEFGLDYEENDLLAIAYGQHKAIEEAQGDLIICDTDVLTVIIWMATKFGKTDDQLMKLWAEFKPVKYLVCKPDVPWVYDPLREREHPREELFDLQIKLLESSDKAFEVIEGDYPNRYEMARKIINASIKA